MALLSIYTYPREMKHVSHKNFYTNVYSGGINPNIHQLINGKIKGGISIHRILFSYKKA